MGSLPYNVSLPFTLRDEEKLVEIIALDLPENIHVIFERSVQYDDCADETWIAYQRPCCEKHILDSETTSFFIVAPNKYRMVLMEYDAVADGYIAPSTVDTAGVTLLSIEVKDTTGTLRKLFHCCD